jgi:putative DNA methylase
MRSSEVRTYIRGDCITFRRTKERFGGLSNMAPGFPVRVNGLDVRTSEALYQACRFPHRPDLQELIIGQRSPMTAKMKSKPYRSISRPDWDRVRIRVMRWCLRVKLAQNWDTFAELLLATGERPIVEDSRKDDFWGAKDAGDGTLIGVNALGRLLMELREEIRTGDWDPAAGVEPLDIPDFELCGEPIRLAEPNDRTTFRARPRSRDMEEPRTDEPQYDLISTREADQPPRQRTEPSIPEQQVVALKTRKKLIEVALPLDAINTASAREKSIRHGHPSTLHLWWARRPLAAARAVIFAQMVDDPSDLPDLFPTDKAQEKERQRLFRIIEDLVLWENTTNESVLQRARDEIWKSWKRACAENADHPRARELFDRDVLPAFHDPFAGGGALPLEAQRLGLESYASDLNPVAVLINKAMIEIPPKFAGRPPVNPEARKDRSLIAREWRGAQGLAEDVRYYGQWMRNEAEKRIGHLYPKMAVTLEIARERPDLKPYVGQKLTVIAWLWARTVKSPNPAFGQVDVPLASTFMLSTKAGKEAYVEPVIENGGFRFTVKAGIPKDLPAAKAGTKLGRGSNFRCILSGAPIAPDYIMAEGVAGRIGARMMAIVAEGDRGRLYLPPTTHMEEVAHTAKPAWKPDSEFFQQALGFRVGNYGMTKWSDLFTDRQLVTLTLFADAVHEVRDLVKQDALATGSPDKDEAAGLESGGMGATAYAEAVSTYLAFALNRVADKSSSLAWWMAVAEKMAPTFSRPTLSMVWDFAEMNPFCSVTSNFEASYGWVSKVLDELPADPTGSAAQLDAQTQTWSVDKVVSTDPPYYDNIGYADLSDFFYVWLRRSMRSAMPGLFPTMGVPKAEELVATPERHGGKEKAERFFLEGMTGAMSRLAEMTHPAFPITIYYAFKQAESDSVTGTASTGWETFLAAVIQAGFSITGTWPVRTERSGGLRNRERGSLASSIVLVCHRGTEATRAATRRDFLNQLKSELPVALRHLQRGNIAPVDLAQAAIGPGMAVYTRYARVLDASGKPLSVREALALINQTLDEVLAEQEGDFDADTRWALAWFEQYGFDTGEYGVAETLSKAKNTSVRGMEEAGILVSKGGKVRLLKPSELPADWDPATDPRLTHWEVVHHLIRVLEAEGEGAAAALVTKLGSAAEVARELAYRLYTVCERKKRAQEALSYNGLVQSWPEITRLAQAGPAGGDRPAQMELV